MSCYRSLPHSQKIEFLCEAASSLPNRLQENTEAVFALYPSYTDRPLARAAGEFLAKAAEISPEVFEQLAAGVANSKRLVSASDAFTVLDWVDVILVRLGPRAELLKAQKALLGRCVEARRLRLARGAFHHVRSTIAKLIVHGHARYYLDTFDESLFGLVVFGALAGAAADIAPLHPSVEDEVKTKINDFAKAFVKTILGAKCVPAFIHEALTPAIDLLDQTNIDSTIAQALARAILRAPEEHLCKSLTFLVAHTSDLDWSAASKCLINSLTTSIGSSNPIIRKAAADAWISLLQRSSDPSELNAAALKLFDKAYGTEQRQLVALIAAHLPESSELVTKITRLAAKEAGETAVPQIAAALIHLFPNPEALNAYKKGLQGEGKTSYARALANALEHGLPQIPDDLAEPLQAIVDDKMIFRTAAGYSAVVCGATADPEMFSAKQIERIKENVDIDIACKAAVRVADTLLAKLSDNHQELATNLIHVCILAASYKEPRARNAGLKSLEHLYSSYPETGVMIAKLMMLNSNPPKSYKSIMSILGRRVSPIEAAERTLIASLLIAHHPNCMPTYGWIGLCQNAGVDPGHLLDKNLCAVLESLKCMPTHLKIARKHALATLAIVDVHLIVPKLCEHLCNTLKPILITDDDRIILATSEGLLAPTSKVKKRHSNVKRSADEWEQLRQEIAEKKGEQLSADDVRLLEEQTARRLQLQVFEHQYEEASELITLLSEHYARGAANGIKIWFPEALRLLIPISQTPLGSNAKICLLGLSRNVDREYRKYGQVLIDCFGKEKSNRMLTELLYALLEGRRKVNESTGTISLVYYLPVLEHIIRNARKLETEEDQETLLLALKVIASQSPVLAQIDRHNLVEVLLGLMDQVDKAADAKESLERLAQCSIFTKEETGILLKACLSSNQFMRRTALEVLDSEVDLSDIIFAAPLWIAQFGDDAELAATIWQDNGMTLPEDVLNQLESYLASPVHSVAAVSYAAAVGENKVDVARHLFTLYDEKSAMPEPILDEFGLEVSPGVDPWELRLGIVETIGALLSQLEAIINEVMAFVVRAVADRNLTVAAQAEHVGQQLIRTYGASHVNELLPYLQSVLENQSGEKTDLLSKNTKARQDEIEAACVVLLGLEAQTLPFDDERLSKIIILLMNGLQSESESIQIKVSNCLTWLALQNDLTPHIETLLSRVTESDNEEARRGAAHGIAGLIKGAGISGLADYDIISRLEAVAQDRSDAKRRQGFQLTVYALSRTLGKIFEPYALSLLPLVLTGLGDPTTMVRESANDAAREIMRNTTNYGMKMEIPLVLSQLEDIAWRVQKGAVEMLGTMAYLDPRQLSESLSTVIPKIVGALNESHKEVRAAAKASLRKFGQVIENPEIKAIVPDLLNAISDPTNKTDAALEALLKTRFIHFVDSPSLALVMHVIARGVRDRSASTRRMACKVVGNLSILTQGNDLAPYLPAIVPSLQTAMTDPVPETCAVACKAMGTLVQKLGEQQFPDIIADMFATLSDASKSSDWFGTARGLAEVLHGLGLSKLEDSLPRIISGCCSPESHVRQGHAPLLLLIPVSFGPLFEPYLEQIIPPLVRCLADTVEDIRQIALKAARRLIADFTKNMLSMLLSTLHVSMGESNWRIRMASVELTGELLAQISGVRRNGDSLDEPRVDASNVNSEQSPIAQAFGSLYAPTMAGLFVCRSDVVGSVRQVANEVWMEVITNTPHELLHLQRDVMLCILSRLVAGEELAEIGERALADFVRRSPSALLWFPSFFEELIENQSILELGPIAANRSVYIGVKALVCSLSESQLRNIEPSITKLIRQGLTNSEESVRIVASEALDALHNVLGNVADDILPSLLSQLEAGSENALAALKGMIPTAAETIFPALMRALLIDPITPFKANKIAEISTVVDRDLLSQWIDRIIDTLLNAEMQAGKPGYEESVDCILIYCTPHIYLLQQVKGAETARRNVVFSHMAKLFEKSGEYTQSFPDIQILSEWLNSGVLALENEALMVSAHAMLIALVNVLSKSQQAELSDSARRALLLTGSPLPGLSLPQGPSCIVPYFVNGLTTINNPHRVECALAMGELVKRLDPNCLKPYVTTMVGPLIRVIGERCTSELKSAIVYTLHLLLSTIPNFLKPFLPQLQRIFVKLLADPSSAVLRQRVARALGTLIPLQTRIDPLIKDILSGLNVAKDEGIFQAMLQALLEILTRVGASISDSSRSLVYDFLLNLPPASDTKDRLLYAKLIASLAIIVEPGLTSGLGSLAKSDEQLEILTLNAVLTLAPNSLPADGVSVLINATGDPDPSNSFYALCGLGKFILKDFDKSSENVGEAVQLLKSFVDRNDSRTNDARRISLVVLRAVAREKPELLQLDAEFVTSLFMATRDTSIPVKLAAENTFLEIFQFVDKNSEMFDEWFANAQTFLAPNFRRSIPEYVTRVALRRASARREQDAAGTSDSYASDLAEILQISPSNVVDSEIAFTSD